MYKCIYVLLAVSVLSLTTLSATAQSSQSGDASDSKVAASAETVGSTVFNRGVGGNNSANLLARVDAQVVALKPDLVVLMVGTNDMLNSGNSVPLDKYEANLNTLADKITGSGSRLVLMTIPPCHEPLLLTRHPAEFYARRSPGEKIEDANRVIRRIAKERKIPLVDLHRLFDRVGAVGESPESLIRNPANSGASDGVHPTPDGYRMIAVAVYQAICDHDLPTGRVVCFGDSITFGSGASQPGTTQGESYPAWLQRLLEPAK